MSANHVLYDLPGPKAVRRDRIYNVVFTLVFVALLAWFVQGAYERGLFNDRWSVLWDPHKGQTASGLWWDSLLMRGIVGTLTPVLIAIPIVMVLAVVVTTMRASLRWWFRIPARVLTEVFRGVPVLLVILFGVLALDWKSMHAVVLGLVVYNTAVVAEILRAGIAALPSGQKEAGLSVGLTPLQTTLQIQLPQAVRIMLPALVSQAVVLLKDSSLGFIIGYPELLTTIKNNYNFFGEQSKVVFVLVGFVLYVGLNLAVSRLAHWLERKMGSKTKVLVAPGARVGGGVVAAGLGGDTRTGNSHT
jgi:glutamate transport system permease protein